MLMMPMMMAGTYYEARRQQKKDFAQAMEDFTRGPRPALAAHPRLPRGRGPHPSRRAPERRRLPDRGPRPQRPAVDPSPRRQRLRRAPARPRHPPVPLGDQDAGRRPLQGRGLARGLGAAARPRGRARRARSSRRPLDRRCHRRRRPARQRPRRRPLGRAPDRRAALAGRARRLLLRLGQLGARLGLPQVAAAHDVAAQPDRRRPPRRQRPGLLGARRRPRGHHRGQGHREGARAGRRRAPDRPRARRERRPHRPQPPRRHRRARPPPGRRSSSGSPRPSSCSRRPATPSSSSATTRARSPATSTPARRCSPSPSTASATTRRWPAPASSRPSSTPACRSTTRATCRVPSRCSPSPAPTSRAPRRPSSRSGASRARSSPGPTRPPCCPASPATCAPSSASRARAPSRVDIRSDGPHALVGGTTGAGKSELLQAWILGMAAAHSPQRVTFLLVDYKGGSAFRDCVKLPHTVGLVTDLSPHLVRRALASLAAELHYREHLLARHKAKDLVELERRGEVDAPPSLILVVDEFAALVQEVPEFVDGVVNVAQRGRSLGLHLILATQRPAGVIKDNLRANTNLRMALRMADENDSDDVLGSKEAAFFDPALPGRAVSKTGPGRLVPFQTGYAGGWTSDVPPPPDMKVETLTFGRGVEWEPPRAEGADDGADLGPTDIQRLVGTLGRAARAGRAAQAAQAVAARHAPGLRPRDPADAAPRRRARLRRRRRPRQPGPARDRVPPRQGGQHRDLRHVGLRQVGLPALDGGRGRLHGARRALPRLRSRLRQPRSRDARGAAARRLDHPRRRPRARDPTAPHAPRRRSTSGPRATRPSAPRRSPTTAASPVAPTSRASSCSSTT